MEEAIAQGKSINKEQEEVCSKPAVLSLIDELDKLCQPLTQVIAEELSLLTYDYVTDDATDLLNEQDLIRFRCSAACWCLGPSIRAYRIRMPCCVASSTRSSGSLSPILQYFVAAYTYLNPLVHARWYSLEDGMDKKVEGELKLAVWIGTQVDKHFIKHGVQMQLELSELMFLPIVVPRYTSLPSFGIWGWVYL